MSVFVVGADGSLGSALVEALGAVPVRFRHPGETLDGRVPDIASAKAVVNVTGPRVRPGLDWSDYMREHVGGAAAVARSMPHGAHLVHVSSAAVYGARPGRPVGPDDPPAPRTFPNASYAWAKLAAEDAVRAVAAERGLRLSILRPAMVYGSGLTSALDTVLNAAARGVNLALYPRDGRQSCVHVSLFTSVVARLVEGEALARPLPVADPFHFTNRDLERAAALRNPRVTLPAPLSLAGAVARRWPTSPAHDPPGALAALAVLGLDTVFDGRAALEATGLAESDYRRHKTLDPYLEGHS